MNFNNDLDLETDGIDPFPDFKPSLWRKFWRRVKILMITIGIIISLILILYPFVVTAYLIMTP